MTSRCAALKAGFGCQKLCEKQQTRETHLKPGERAREYYQLWQKVQDLAEKRQIRLRIRASAAGSTPICDCKATSSGGYGRVSAAVRPLTSTFSAIFTYATPASSSMVVIVPMMPPKEMTSSPGPKA